MGSSGSSRMLCTNNNTAEAPEFTPTHEALLASSNSLGMTEGNGSDL